MGGEAWAELSEEALAGVLARVRLLECGSAVVKRVNTVRALKSTRGRRVQPLYGDAADDRTLGHLRAADVPLSIIWAIQPGTRLWVHRHGCRSTGEEITLQVGDVLVCRGDMIHGGSTYECVHYRVHAYVDAPPTIFERPRDHTCECALHHEHCGRGCHTVFVWPCCEL